MDHMKLPEFLWIKDQLDIVDNGGNVLQCSTLNQKKKKEKETINSFSALS